MQVFLLGHPKYIQIHFGFIFIGPKNLSSFYSLKLK